MCRRRSLPPRKLQSGDEGAYSLGSAEGVRTLNLKGECNAMGESRSCPPKGAYKVGVKWGSRSWSPKRELEVSAPEDPTA